MDALAAWYIAATVAGGCLTCAFAAVVGTSAFMVGDRRTARFAAVTIVVTALGVATSAATVARWAPAGALVVALSFTAMIVSLRRGRRLLHLHPGAVTRAEQSPEPYMDDLPS